MKKVLFVLSVFFLFFDVSAATKIKFGYTTSSTDPRAVAATLFESEVEKNSKGRISVELFDSTKLSSLGMQTSDTDLIESIMHKGPLDMTVSSAGNFAVYDPEIGVSALPYLFDDFESAWAFLDSDFSKALSTKMEDLNIVVLAWFTNGFRCITTTEHKITSLADLKDLHLRTSANAVVMKTLSAFGCHAEPLDFGKLYSALKNGRFRGQENPIPAVYIHQFYSVQKYLAVTNHSFDAMPLVIKKDVWEALSSEDRAIIGTAAKNAQDLNRRIIKKQTETLLAELENQGMTITYPDLEEFKKACEPVYDFYNALYEEDFMAQALKLAGRK